MSWQPSLKQVTSQFTASAIADKSSDTYYYYCYYYYSLSLLLPVYYDQWCI